MNSLINFANVLSNAANMDEKILLPTSSNIHKTRDTSHIVRDQEFVIENS